MEQDQIKKFKEIIKNQEEAYYKGEETISDELYDFKLRKLKALGVDTDNLPIGKVHSEKSNLKYPHSFPMLSLDNAFNETELHRFFDNHLKELKISEKLEYFIEPKVDGVSISLHYKNGELIQALSRGNGNMGESLIEHIRQINSIPKCIDYPSELLVRGEIFISDSDFKEIQSNTSESQRQFLSSRNYVAGALRLKETQLIRYKKLSFCAYQVLFPDSDRSLTNQSDAIELFRSLGIPTHQESFTLISSDISKIWDFLRDFRERRRKIELPNDGLVIKLNQTRYYSQIGSTSKFPKWAIAYKYPSLIKETTLEKIEVTVGRSGRITYLGKLTPVFINGSWINYVSLHNFENIKKLNLREGIKVQVYKSGEVIPQILGRVDEEDSNYQNNEFQLIEYCPCCNTHLVFKGGNKLQYCVNPNCERKEICKICHFCSKAGLDIEGLSEMTITKLFKEGILKNILDIYSLWQHKERIFQIENLNIKDKSFNNLITSIEKSKKVTPNQLLSGLGIEHLGPEVVKLLLEKFQSIEKIFEASGEEIQSIIGIGPKVSASLKDWISREENVFILSELKKIGFKFEAISSSKNENHLKNQNHYLYGKSVLITGSFSISREKLKEKLAEKYNLKFKSSFSSEINYLLAGESPGSKLQTAIQNNIPVIYSSEVESLLSL